MPKVHRSCWELRLSRTNPGESKRDPYRGRIHSSVHRTDSMPVRRGSQVAETAAQGTAGINLQVSGGSRLAASPVSQSEPARAERHLNAAQFSDANSTLRRIREKPEVRAFRPSVDIRHEPTEEPAAADGAPPAGRG